MSDHTRSLYALGQSLWLDNITRGMLHAGTLKDYRDRLAVTGLTSNPTIFESAIRDSEDYDATIRAAGRGADPEKVFFDLAIEDLRQAAEVFAPVHARTDGVDGWVSLEVSPLLANDARGTIEQALALHRRAGIANLYIKVPGTPAGTQAIEELTYRGVPVNVTLLFSPRQYEAAAAAYLKGLERRLDEGLPLGVSSVASVFISRWDVKVAKAVPEELHNRLGLAVAGSVYARYRALLAGPRLQRLMNAGARPQRLLWASTGTKDPAASDTLYVDNLVAPLTINTMPEKTLLAAADHARPGPLLEADDSAARAMQARFAERGLQVDELAETLQEEGAASFVKSWNGLRDTIRQRLEQVA